MEFFDFNNSGIEYKIPSVQSGYDANNSRFFSAVKRGGVHLTCFGLLIVLKNFSPELDQLHIGFSLHPCIV